jgi:cyclase
MLKTRIIPCLLLHDGGLVKTEKFKKPKYVGDPINAVRLYNDMEVDELIFLDIDASKQKRQPDFAVIKDLATECFMPFAYGGGIQNIEQIERILSIGVEKVIINNACLENLKLIEETAKHFGSSTIIVAIDIKKELFGPYKIFNHVKNKNTNLNPLDYAVRIAEAGAGEIFVNNVDREGTYSGFDIEILSQLNQKVSCPLIACGGAASLEDMKKAVSLTGVSAVAAGSVFVYQGPHRAVLISYPAQKQLKEIFS